MKDLSLSLCIKKGLFLSNCENTFPKFQTPSKLSIFLPKSVTTMDYSQVKTKLMMTSTQMSVTEMVSMVLTVFCRNYLVYKLTVASFPLNSDLI